MFCYSQILFQADETKFCDLKDNPAVRACGAEQPEFSSPRHGSGHTFIKMPRLHLSCVSRKYAANGVRLPKGVAFGRAAMIRVVLTICFELTKQIVEI